MCGTHCDELVVEAHFHTFFQGMVTLFSAESFGPSDLHGPAQPVTGAEDAPPPWHTESEFFFLHENACEGFVQAGTPWQAGTARPEL